MNYTIRVREKIDPEYIVVQGATGPESRLNPGPPVENPPSFVRCIYSDMSGLYGDDPTKRVEIWEDVNGSADDAEVFEAAPGLRASAIDQVKSIRQQALSAVVKNAGILAVYDENYRAAVSYQAGEGDSTVMKDGQTATQYLAGFAMPFGMTAPQFAAYIIAENRRVNPTAYQIEQEYLRCAYAVIPLATTVSEVLAIPENYRAFCGV